MPFAPRSRRRPAELRWWLAAIVVGAMLLPSSPGLPGSVGPALPPGAPRPTQVEVAPAYVPGPGVASIGPLGGDSLLDIAVALTPNEGPNVDARLALEYTPGSPEFHQFLTPTEATADVGPSAASYGAAVAYFRSQGLSVTPTSNRLLLLLEGPSTSLAAAFHTEFELYRSGSSVYYSHPTPATLPALASWAGAIGLGNQSAPRPFLGRSAVAGTASPSTGCPLVFGLSPCAVQTAYNASSLYGTGENGTGFRIGVVDPYDGREPQTQLSADLRTFTKEFGLSVGNVQYEYPVPTLRDLNTSYPGWNLENPLDLEWSRAMAPGASIDMTFSPDSGASLYFAIDWLVSQHAVDVISLSWGEPDVGVFNSYAQSCSSGCNATTDGSYTILHPVLAAAALEGIGVFAATGDCGAAMGTNGLSTSYPSSDSYVTGVGATNLALASGQYGAESGWSGNDSGAKSPGCQNQGGSGGGFSPLPRPYWQSAPGLPTTPSARGTPDVSIVGGTPVVTVVDGNNITLLGTSVSTPIWAGLAAVADQLHGAPLGFLNPSLYALARSPSAASLYHDVLQGSNGYSAGHGWDPVTGIGSPIVSALLPALSAGAPGPVGIYTDLKASVRFGSTPLTVTLSATATGGAPPYDGYDLDFGDGNATWSSNGLANHTYPKAGTYLARATVYDADGNSSSAPPVLIVVGGGSALHVSLTANDTTPSAGAPVLFTPAVSGGASPYRYSISFGDGTYDQNSTNRTFTHRYLTGGYCANVVVTDSAAPTDGGASTVLPITVGAAAPAPCDDPGPLTVSFTSALRAADLPGDLPITVTTNGGAGPISVRLVSDDPYVDACQCGLFSTVGAHAITAYVNDSLDAQTTAALSVTMYPSLAASFAMSPLSGIAPLSVGFSAAVSGGHGASAGATDWTFGDGSAGTTTASGVHAYTTPGIYVAQAVVRDAGNGSASETFLVDVRSPSAPGGLGASAVITAGPASRAGDLVQFSADASGGAGGYLYRWNLGENDSAFGPSVNQSYGAGCVADGRCPLVVELSIVDGNGTWWNATIPVDGALAGRSDGLVLADSGVGSTGPTPYRLTANASVSGMPNATVTWEYGDGARSTGPNGSHTYLIPGDYTLTETATDAFGDLQVRTHALQITGLARSAPSLFAVAPPSVGIAPYLVKFNVSATGGSGGPYSYAWAFGDGTTGVGGNTTHIYYERGNYSAVVTVTDALGDPNSTTFRFSVYNTTFVDVNLTITPSRVVPGAPVVLTIVAAVACTSGSIPGCGPAAVTFNATIAGEWVASTAYSMGGISEEFVAPGSPGSYDVHVAPSGTNFSGAADVNLEVAASTTSPISSLWAESLGAAAGGAVAVGVLAVFLRRRPPAVPATP